MSDVIHLLPDSVANQIAAGEVIQRPASVIKELVENAVDAGADNIDIVLRDGGKNLIQVIDNGCGMSETDARLAFERHATSKITQAADLFELHTMGFRGEALPSIAAVAQIELHTMRKGDAIGSCLHLAASKFESQEADACPQGTNIAVKNLFFNFPARRKFLKKDSVELNHILHEFERLALVNPDKGFNLIHNDVTLHRLVPGTMKQRIVELFGKSLEKQLIPVHTETSLVKINGFVSLPENTRKRNPLQYFFVNGRNMKHPYFQKAVLHCYEDLIAADHQPNFFLSFEVVPQTIDVNIHPTKSEIKFENETPIWQILVAAIKEALGKFNAVPSIDFDTTATIDIPAFDPAANPSFNPIEIDPEYNPFAPSAQQPKSAPKPAAESKFRPEGEPSTILDNWDKLYDGFRTDRPDNTELVDLGGEKPTGMPPAEQMTGSYNPFAPTEAPAHTPLFAPGATAALEESSINTAGSVPVAGSSARNLLQFNNRYFIVPCREGLMVIDRTRAHIKVLFEQFMKLTDHGGTQQIMFPETLSLSLSQHVALEGIIDEVRSLGFDLSYLGDRVWGINGVPEAIGKLNPAEVLINIIDNVQQQTQAPADDIRRSVALSLAMAAAVSPSQVLTDAEADALLGSFFALAEPAFTPDGRRTYFLIESDECSRRLS